MVNMESTNANEFEEVASMELDTNTSVSSASTNTARNAFLERIRHASQCIQSGDYNSAIRLYNEALKLDPTNHVLYGNRSAVYCRLGKYDKALQDAIKARELNPNWSKAYYRQGFALQCLRRFPDALAAFASGLAQEAKSVQLLSAFVETAMKSPLRATLEPIYRQLQVMNFDKSPFVIASVVGQELLASNHYTAAIVVLESALRIGSCSLKLRGSVFSALSSAYWALNDLDKAIAYMQQDLQVAKQLGDSLGECRAHANLGSAYFAKCSYKEALAAHRYQLVLAMKHKHNEQAALALTSLGHVYTAIGDLKNALSSHQQCLQLVRKLGDPLAEAREMGNVGSVHLACGESEEAIECHLEHVKLSKLLGNKSEEARAYSNLGSSYHYRRQYEQAIQFHEQVLRISQEIGDRAIESKAYAGLGHAARCMSDHIQAKRWYERQLDIALNTKDKPGEARACSNLGLVYQLLGDFDGALKLHWSHLNICKQLGDSAGIGRAYGNIGNAYSALKQYEEAIKYHKLELQISKEVHDRAAEASAHGHLALAYQAIGVYDRALTHLNLHLSVASEIKDVNSEASALCNLGNYYCLRKEYEKAIHFYQEYLQRTQTLDDKESIAKASHLLGFANYSIKNYDAALVYFEQDLILSKEIQDRVSIGRAYCHLGYAKAALGFLDDALECQKFYLCTVQNDSINRLQAIANVAEILTRQTNYTEAMKMLEKKLSLARTLGDVVQEANAFAALGACQKAAGNFDKAALYYKQELLFRQGAQNVKAEIRSLENLGDCYFQSCNYALALKCFMEQLEKSEQLNFKTLPDELVNNEYDSDGYYGRRRRVVDSLREYLESCQVLSSALHNVANTRFRMGHYEEAVNFFDRELRLLQQSIDRSEQLYRNSSELRKESDYGETTTQPNAVNGHKHHNSTSIILDELVVKRIQCSRSIGDCHFALRRYDDAIQHYLEFLASSKSLVEQEQVYCYLGKCYQLVNNLAQALVSYEKRLVLAHELGQSQTKAIAYGELGHSHRMLGNYEQAITCFKHEQELAKDPILRTQDGPKTFVSDFTGFCMSDKTKINVGLFIEAEALHGLGCVAQEMHDYERALKYHSSALAIAQEIQSLELESRAYGAIGSAYNALGNFESSIKYQEKYLSVAQLVGDLNAQVTALSALGKIHCSSSQYEHAAKYLLQALHIVEKYDQSIGHRDEEEARICYELGMALWALDDLEVAESHLRRSVDLIEKFHNFNSSNSQLPIAPIHTTSLLPASCGIYGSICGSSTGSDSSSSHYGQLQMHSLMRQSSRPQPIHHHLHYQGASYEALIKILIALQRPTDALLIAERSRTRLFLKSKQGFKVSPITSVEQIIEMARSQNAAILYYTMSIDGTYNSWLITPKGVRFSPMVKSRREKISQLLASVQNSLLHEEHGRLNNNAADECEMSGSQPYNRSMHHLNRNHFLNSSNYSLSSLFSLASSVTSTSTASSSRHANMARHRQSSSGHFNSNLRFGSSSNLPQDANSFHGNMKRSVSSGHLSRHWQDSSSLASLFNILIGPFQEQLDEESSLSQLLLVLDGDLFLVPWSMLCNANDEFLSERYSILVVPSLHVLRSDQDTKSLRKSPPHSTITSLVVANPTMPNKLAKNMPHQRQLYYENPASSKEASFISELLSTRPLIGTEANKEAVLAQLSTAQCIHFSSYIIDNTDGDPLKMATGLGIAISPSDMLIGDSAHQLHDHEYLLTPHDLISIGLSAKLVVISCCALSSRSNSHAAALNATTTFSSSQVFKTITSALLQAGASCVLLTLWPVPLSALQVLFRIFYCSLLQGTRVSAALNEAVSSIQNTSHFSHPRNWAGFLLIGSDVRLSSQVALMSSSLATLLKVPEKSREAMRVVLHLVEKSLQRIQRGHKNAMYTTLQSIENKVGPHTQGWRELLISVGFRFEPASTNGLPACVFFPQSDPGGRLLRGSNALQAILALSPSTIHAISKLISNSECVPEIISQLNQMIEHETSDGAFNDAQLNASTFIYLETLSLKLWSAPGCHELYASLGFDLMEVGANSVTLRAGKHANIRTIMFAWQTLNALFDKENNMNQATSSPSNSVSISPQSSVLKHLNPISLINSRGEMSNYTEEKPMIPNNNMLSFLKQDELDGAQIVHDPNSPNRGLDDSPTSISALPCSRSTIGRNHLDTEFIEQKLKSMSMQPLETDKSVSHVGSSHTPCRLMEPSSTSGKSDTIHQRLVSVTRSTSQRENAPTASQNAISADLQSISSSSSIATANTVLHRLGPSTRVLRRRRSQFSFDSTASSNSSQCSQQQVPSALLTAAGAFLVPDSSMPGSPFDTDDSVALSEHYKLSRATLKHCNILPEGSAHNQLSSIA